MPTTAHGERRLDRGRIVTVEENRRQRARAIAQLLGMTVNSLKLILFADVMAAFGNGNNSTPLVPLIILLVITFFFMVYFRVFCPPISKLMVGIELIATCCDLGSFISGIIVAVTPHDDFERMAKLGWAMLIFQVVGLMIELVPPVVMLLWKMIVLAFKLVFKRQTPKERFAEAVWLVMAQDPDILARKFADRWMIKVLGRGLDNRELLPHEIGIEVLPRFVTNLGRSLKGGMSTFVSRSAVSLKSFAPRSRSMDDAAAMAVEEADSMDVPPTPYDQEHPRQQYAD